MVKKVSEMWDPLFYISCIIKYEWSELVECEIYLPSMVKMMCDNYWGTDRNEEWQLIGDGWSIFPGGLKEYTTVMAEKYTRGCSICKIVSHD